MTRELDHAISTAALDLTYPGGTNTPQPFRIADLQQQLGHNPHRKYAQPIHPNKIRAVLKRNGYEEIGNAVFRKRP